MQGSAPVRNRTCPRLRGALDGGTIPQTAAIQGRPERLKLGGRVTSGESSCAASDPRKSQQSLRLSAAPGEASTNRVKRTEWDAI